MILSRNWLNEFVDLKDITDKEFNDEMTLSGSKVETIERPDENLKNVVVGLIVICSVLIDVVRRTGKLSFKHKKA